MYRKLRTAGKEIEDAVSENDLLITSVLSGNRNFEGRIHPLVKETTLHLHH